MTFADTIALLGIAISAIVTIVGWFVAWRIAKSPVKLTSEQPPNKPKPNDSLERRDIRGFRVMQLALSLSALFCSLLVGQMFLWVEPIEKVDLLYAIAATAFAVGCAAAIVALQVLESSNRRGPRQHAA